LREISANEAVKFIGATGITTASDSEGNITITGPNLSNYVTLDGEQTLTNKTLTSPTITDGVFQDSFTIGQQVFIEHGANGFSVNEDFDIVGASNFTGYHYTSGAGRTGVAFTLARTAQFTNGFGVHGTSADNEFVIGSEFGNTDFVFKRNIGMPFDVSGGTILFTIRNDGALIFSDGSVQTTAWTGTGNITFATTTIDTTDSSGITFTPAVVFNSDLTVENDLIVANQIRSSTGDIYATESFVAQAVNELIGAAPEALNTLQELAAALGNDENFATTILNALAQATNTVRYDINNQGLTEQQKQNARTNIGAVAEADVYAAAIVMG
jgi:hypothetical protein